jgi:hypothetical protein
MDAAPPRSSSQRGERRFLRARVDLERERLVVPVEEMGHGPHAEGTVLLSLVVEAGRFRAPPRHRVDGSTAVR